MRQRVLFDFVDSSLQTGYGEERGAFLWTFLAFFLSSLTIFHKMIPDVESQSARLGDVSERGVIVDFGWVQNLKKIESNSIIPRTL